MMSTSRNEKPLRIEIPKEPTKEERRKDQLDRYKENVQLARYVLAQYGAKGRTPIPEAAWEAVDKIMNDPALRKGANRVRD